MRRLAYTVAAINNPFGCLFCCRLFDLHLFAEVETWMAWCESARLNKPFSKVKDSSMSAAISVPTDEVWAVVGCGAMSLNRGRVWCFRGNWAFRFIEMLPTTHHTVEKRCVERWVRCTWKQVVAQLQCGHSSRLRRKFRDCLGVIGCGVDCVS